MNNRFFYSLFLVSSIVSNAIPMTEQSIASGSTEKSGVVSQPVSAEQTPLAAGSPTSVAVPATGQPVVLAPAQSKLSDQLPVGTVVAIGLSPSRGAPRYLMGSLNDSNPLVRFSAGIASGRDVFRFTVMENNNGMIALANVTAGRGRSFGGASSVRYLGIEAAQARLVTLPGSPQYFELVGNSLNEVRLKCATNSEFVTYQGGVGIVAMAASEAEAYPFSIQILAQPQLQPTVAPQQASPAPIMQPVQVQPGLGGQQSSVQNQPQQQPQTRGSVQQQASQQQIGYQSRGQGRQ